MFSLPISFPSPSAFGRIFSLDSWLAHLKSWHHSDRRFNSAAKFDQDSRTHCGAISIPVLPSVPGSLSLNLPSPTMHLSFDLDPGLSFETDSETSSPASSRCSTPSLEDDRNLETTLKSSDAALAYNPPSKIATTSLPVAIHTVSHINRESLLSQYSHQELVLLEFLTHAPNVDVRDIDEILCMYPPGFTNACHCVSQEEEAETSTELCEVCRLADAYIEYSFERCRGDVEISA